MQALKIEDESQWRKFRRVAFEIWRKGTKTHADEDQYMPIGDIQGQEMTEDELNSIWEKYGKIN
jgi:hypothetical protein